MRAVLIISPEPWNAHAVSKHHYAKTLADRGIKVFFLNPPDSSLRGIQIEEVRGTPGLFVVAAPHVARGLRFYPSSLRLWRELRWLHRLEQTAKCRIDTVWLFENSRFFDMRFAGSRLKIYHQVDLNQDFRPQQAAATADICFCTTSFIRTKLRQYSPHVYKVHHGFAQVPNPMPLTEEQIGRFKNGAPHAVYIGNLELEYLDVELLSGLAKQFPDVQFHFVGGYSPDGKLRLQTASCHNVTWWGKVENALVPAILDRADILLVTYKAERFREQLASPHKFMEYLGSGKTVVSTYTDEYKDRRHLLEMVDDSSEFAATFERVVRNLARYNSPAKQRERIDFARMHTYQGQLDRVLSHLRENRLMADNKDN